MWLRDHLVVGVGRLGPTFVAALRLWQPALAIVAAVRTLVIGSKTVGRRSIACPGHGLEFHTDRCWQGRLFPIGEEFEVADRMARVTGASNAI
jgi:hypothetical protein